MPTEIEVDNCDIKVFEQSLEIDKVHHKDGIARSIYARSLNLILSLDFEAESILAYDVGLVKANKLVEVQKENHPLDLMIIDFAYSETDQRIGGVLRDNSICFWEANDDFKFEKRIPSNLDYF